MSAEEVLRAAILKQISRPWSSCELHYNLRDSSDAEAFVRVHDGRSYSDSTLQAKINAIRPKLGNASIVKFYVSATSTASFAMRQIIEF